MRQYVVSARRAALYTLAFSQMFKEFVTRLENCCAFGACALLDVCQVDIARDAIEEICEKLRSKHLCHYVG